MQHIHLNKESIFKKKQSTHLSHKTHYNCHNINEQKTNSIIRSSHQSILLL